MSLAVITKPTRAQIKKAQEKGSVLVYFDKTLGQNDAASWDHIEGAWLVTGMESTHTVTQLLSGVTPLALFYEED